MSFHQLKTWPGLFTATLAEDKPWEFRRNDRDFEIGDRVLLQEWDPNTRSYTGREIYGDVGYVIRGPDFGVTAGYCVVTFHKDLRV